MITVAIVSQFPECEEAITGGVESAVWNLVQGLRKHTNLKLYVVAPLRSAEYVDSMPDVTVIRYRKSRLPGFIDYWTFERRKIRKILRQISPDIVHYQALAGQAVFSEFPSVHTIHGIAELDLRYKHKPFKFVRRFIVKKVETFSRNNIENLVVISPYVKEFLEKMSSYREIPNAIDDRYFDVTNTPQNTNVLYVGRISKLKNVDGMLRVFERLLDKVPDAHLNIIGSPENAEYLRECKEFVRSAGITESVSFLGSKNVLEIRDCMQTASCLLLLSRQENAPMVVAEAMAVGLPVIATNSGGISHMFEDGRSGFLASHEDVDDIVDKLQCLLTDGATQAEMAHQAKRMSERYRTSAVALETHNFYFEITNKDK